MTTQTAQQSPIQEARENLKVLSLEVKDLVQDGTFHTINDAIMETLYKTPENRAFKSYSQWRQEGYQVRKGEKAYLLWGRPKKVQAEMEGKSSEEIDQIANFFPLAYLFSNKQVDIIQVPEGNTEPAPADLPEIEY